MRQLTMTILALISIFAVCCNSYAVTYTYDSLNRLSTVTYDNGQTVTYAYDKAGNMRAANAAGLTLYTLTVNKLGNGTGDVTASTGEISWSGSSGTASETAGTSVTLTATPGAASKFVGWAGGGCAGAGNCSVNLTADTTIKALFALSNEKVLWITKSGNGSGTVKMKASPAATSCGDACYVCKDVVSKSKVKKIAKATITASAFTGSIFTGWSGDCQGKKTVCSITVNEDKTVMAYFGKPKVAVSVNALTFADTAKKQAATLPLTITNSGDADLKITGLKVMDKDAKMFKVYKNGTKKTISSSTIAAGGTLYLDVSFVPTSVGAKTAKLRIISNDSDTPKKDITLSGTGK